MPRVGQVRCCGERRFLRVKPVPICKLSRVCAHVSGSESENHSNWFLETVCPRGGRGGGEKKEHLYSLSRIWQLSNSLGIHCHIQCHYLTWCLADDNRAQIERQCHGEKGMSPRLQLPFRWLPFIACYSNLKGAIGRVHLLPVSR